MLMYLLLITLKSIGQSQDSIHQPMYYIPLGLCLAYKALPSHIFIQGHSMVLKDLQFTLIGQYGYLLNKSEF